MKKHVGWSLILIVVGAGLMLGGLQMRSAQAAGTNRVGLLISYGNGTVKSQCITFSGEKITGLAVLKASGLPLEVAYSSAGAAVCKIGNVGCPVNNCFCDSPPNFWAYWHIQNGNWVFSEVGASSYSVSNGDVDGWAWGVGQSNPPAQTSFDQICAVLPTPTETLITTPTETPTIKPTRTPTLTQPPSQTPAPTINSPSPTQSPEQSSATYMPTNALEQTESSTLAVNTLFPTAIATSSTPVPATQVPPNSLSTPQTGKGGLASVSGSNNGASNYLFLGVIVLALGIGLFVAAYKKWK
ncbi:MAG: hypothetical protein WCE68_17980 [Anaerolineales bacterium]